MDYVLIQVSITTDDNKDVEGKGIGRKVMDKIYQTYSAELQGKHFAYDGEKSLFTVGPLKQNNFEFTVVLEEASARRYLIFVPVFVLCIIVIFSVKCFFFIWCSQVLKLFPHGL